MEEEKISGNLVRVFEPLPGNPEAPFTQIHGISPQEMALSTNADILFFGGGNGGSKTHTLLSDEGRNVDLKDYRSLIFRRSYAQITEQGGILDDSRRIFPYLGARLNKSDLYWTYPSGAVTGFAHMNNEEDFLNYDGIRCPVYKFDQLEQFTKRQFEFMISRLSSVNCPEIQAYIMCTFNPPEEEDHWIVEDYIWWYLDENREYPDLKKAGVIRWFIQDDKTDKKLWFDSDTECWDYIKTHFPKSAKRPRSFTFIPALVNDNPAMLEKDPDYAANLESLGMVDRERRLKGNFKISFSPGNIFRDEWWQYLEYPPDITDIEVICRAWDRAATKILLQAVKKKKDPDFTASVLIAKLKKTGRFVIYGISEFRETPGKVLQIIKQTALNDIEQFGADKYVVALPQDPGSAGVEEVENAVLELAGLPVQIYTNQGDKITRAKPLSVQVEFGNVSLIRGDWNSKLKGQFKRFPGASHDDIVDAGALGFKVVSIPKPDIKEVEQVDTRNFNKYNDIIR